MHDKRILIATHQMLYGASQALRDYLLREKQQELYYIGLPLLENKEYSYVYFRKGKEKFHNAFKIYFLPEILRYFLDLFVVFLWGIRYGKKDIFIGVDPLNALAGLCLKKIGLIDYVIFYSIDFVPRRFKNNILNNIYHFLEKIAVKYSNETWNVSPRIAEGRQKFLKINENRFPQQVVPIGVWKEELIRKRGKKKNRNILFIGHLLKKQGVQEVIKAMPSILRKIKSAKLIIVGGGEYEDKLRELINDLELHKAVEMRGWVRDRKSLARVMQECSVAVACYMPEKVTTTNFTYYADPTKLKDYLSSGLPIVLTNISYNAKEIEKNKCGIIVKYDKNEISKALLDLIKDEKRLNEYSRNAVKYMNNFTWEKIFKRAFLNYESKKTIRKTT